MKQKGRAATGDAHGTHLHPETICRGSKNGNAKLTDDKVRELKRRCLSGDLQADVADDLNVDFSLVSKIMRRRHWTHVIVEGEDLIGARKQECNRGHSDAEHAYYRDGRRICCRTCQMEGQRRRRALRQALADHTTEQEVERNAV